jgi:hypothetical protein
MVHSNLIFNFLLRQFQDKRKTAGLQKQLIFQGKMSFFPKLVSPTNWGTPPIMLPLVVGFKKISQKSYANDIPK